jgi:O-antigen/teichoic acid export membrane protein
MQTITASSMSQKTISSVGWSTASKFFRQVVQLFFQIILARLLSPADFGMIGMIMVFTAFAEILRNLGFGAALIQNLNSTPAHYHTAFWSNVATGFGLFVVTQLVAPFVARFYEMPGLEQVLRVFSTIFLIGSFNVVQEALLQKQLQFRRLFMMDAISVSIGGVAALFMAKAGWGVWTLVYQYLLITIISSIVLWLTSTWSPQWRFSRSAFADLRKFGLHFTGHEMLNFISRNIDNLLIGKFIGAAALGFYSRAYFLMLQPINITNQVLARVMFPVLARYQKDIVQFKKIYLKSTSLIAFIVFPAVTFVFAMAGPIIELLLGEKWLPVSPLLQIFCIYALVDTIGITTAWIYKSMGRTDTLFRWSIYSTIVITVAIMAGLRWGVMGVAYAYTLAFLVFLWIPGWFIAFRLIDLRVFEMLKGLAPAFVASVLSGTVGWLVSQWLSGRISLFAQTASAFMLSAIAYCLLSLGFNRKTLDILSTVLQPYFKKLLKK